MQLIQVNLYFPSGTYATDSSIVIDKPINILGDGVSTIFKIFTPEKELGIHKGVITVDADDVTIKDILVNGNFTISSLGGADRNSGIYVTPSSNGTIVKNFQAHNTSRQGLCVCGKDGFYENIKIWETARHNVSVGDGSNVVGSAQNNQFLDLNCSGGEDAAFEINDGCQNIYLDGFIFDGTFASGPLRFITHNRVGETNKNIVCRNGYINSNVSGIDIKSDSTTESNQDIYLYNIKIVSNSFALDFNQRTFGFYGENLTIDCPTTKIRIQGTKQSNIKFKNLKIENYTNGGLIDVNGTSGNIFDNIGVDGLSFNSDWSGGNPQILVNYVNGLTLENISVNPTVSASGDGMLIQNCSNVIIRDYKGAKYTSRGIVLVDTSKTLIDKCIISETGGNNLNLTVSDNITIKSSNINNGERGLNVSNCDSVTVDNSSFESNEFGLFVSSSTNFKFINNSKSHSNTSTSGIEINDVNGVLITGDIYENARHGVRLIGSSNIKVLANIYDNNSGNTSGSGIQLRTDGLSIENIQIVNSNIYDNIGNQDFAIDYRLDSGSMDRVFIKNNFLVGGLGGTTITPTSTIIVSDNII